MELPGFNQLSDESIESLKQRAEGVLRSFYQALFLVFLDWLLPAWLRTSYVVLDHLFRTKGFVNSLNTVKEYGRRKMFMGWAWISLLWVFAYKIPSHRRLVMYHTFPGHIVNTALAGLDLLQTETLPDEETMTWIKRKEAALVYFVSAFVIIYRGFIWRMILRLLIIVFVAGLPTLILATQSLKFAALLHKAAMWTVAKVSYGVLGGMEYYDEFFAICQEWIPKTVQRRLYRRQRERPEWKGLPRYEYSSLLPGQIRLMKMETTSLSSPGIIKAEITHVTLDDDALYEAVSYRWGSDKRTHEILLNGTRFAVTESAYELLLGWQTLWHTRTFWMDAISINQNEKSEKTAQVKLMRQIYKSAERVIIFPGGDWTARLGGPYIYELLAAFRQQLDSQLFLGQAFDILKHYPKWKAMTKLITNEYFTRAWIIQEVAVSENVELYYGGLYIPWAIFTEFVARMSHPHIRNRIFTAADGPNKPWTRGATFDNIALMMLFRPESPVDPKKIRDFRMQNLLLVTSKFSTKNPRDKVFSLLGLASPVENRTYDVDYSRDVDEVYKDVMLEDPELTVDLLSLAGTGFSTNRLSLPSWVPDFSEQRLCHPMTEMVSCSGMYSASGDHKPSTTPGPSPNYLLVKGITFDTITAISKAGPLQISDEVYGQTELMALGRRKFEFIQGAREMIHEQCSHDPIALANTASSLWAAVIGDRIWRDRPYSDKYRATLDQWARMSELIASAESHEQLEAFMKEGGMADLEACMQDGTMTDYDFSILDACYGRCFAFSKAQRLCIVPPGARELDEVFVPYGAQTPFLIRGTGDDRGAYELVGECYVHGAMLGEALRFEQREEKVIEFI